MNNPREMYLSHKERQIIIYLALGVPRHEIAKRMHISPHTVHTHITNIYRRMGTHSVPETVAVAITFGLIDVPRLRDEFIKQIGAKQYDYSKQPSTDSDGSTASRPAPALPSTR